MFLNRGMIEASKTEGEMAGVMAHEIAHVALRHGTAQATKGQKFQIGAIAGQILGAIVGGAAGSVIAQGSQFGLGAYFLKYGREYERQADLLGAQIMARAGYDPREMANMFKTIQEQGGRSGPEWLSSHPDPGNRYNAIINESTALRVQGNANTGQFASVKTRLAGMSPAYTAEQIAKGQARSNRTVGTAGRARTVERAGAVRLVSHPSAGELSSRERAVQLGRSRERQRRRHLRAGRRLLQGDNGGTAFTHGVQIGVAQGGSGNLQRDTQQLLQQLRALESGSAERRECPPRKHRRPARD